MDDSAAPTTSEKACPVRRLSPPVLLAALPLLAALSLTGCSADEPEAVQGAPAPVASLPAEIAKISKTVGQYYVAPRGDATPAQVNDVLAKVKSMKGVQSAVRQGEQISVEFLGGASPADHVAVLRQLAALGAVTEGI